MKRKIVILLAVVTAVVFLSTYLIFAKDLKKDTDTVARKGQAVTGLNKTGSTSTSKPGVQEATADAAVKPKGSAKTADVSESGEDEADDRQDKKIQEIKERTRSIRESEISKISEVSGLDRAGSEAVLKYARQFDLEVSLLLAMMKVESNFHQYAVGKSQDRGYFQIIPPSEEAIAKNFGDKIGITYDPDKIFEPDYNIGLAAVYIHSLTGKYKQDLHRILSEYNRGPGKLQTYYEENGTYMTSYSSAVLAAEKKYSKSLS